MYSSDKIMPPLRVWLLLLSVLCGLTIIVYLFEQQESRNENSAKASYIRNKLLSAKRRPVILVMGTSLTQCALDSSELLEASVKKITGCDPLILKIWKKAGSLETLMGAVSGLKQFHPDILLVEANMLCYTPKEIPLDSRLLTAFHHLAKLRLNNVYMPEEKPTVGFQDVNLAVENFRAGIVDTTQLISFRNFAVQEQRSGTKILLVNIPLEGSEEFKKWKSADTALFNSNLNFIRKKLAFKYLDSNMHLDRSYYLDKGHMNEKGFKTFSNWLCNELSRELMNL